MSYKIRSILDAIVVIERRQELTSNREVNSREFLRRYESICALLDLVVREAKDNGRQLRDGRWMGPGIGIAA